MSALLLAMGASLPQWRPIPWPAPAKCFTCSRSHNREVGECCPPVPDARSVAQYQGGPSASPIGGVRHFQASLDCVFAAMKHCHCHLQAGHCSPARGPRSMQYVSSHAPCAAPCAVGGGGSTVVKKGERGVLSLCAQFCECTLFRGRLSLECGQMWVGATQAAVFAEILPE